MCEKSGDTMTGRLKIGEAFMDQKKGLKRRRLASGLDADR